MRRTPALLTALAAAGALAGAGALSAPGHAAPTLTGALIGCPTTCIGTGPVTGGGIIPDPSIRGIRLELPFTIVATSQGGGVDTDSLPVPSPAIRDDVFSETGAPPKSAPEVPSVRVRTPTGGPVVTTVVVSIPNVQSLDTVYLRDATIRWNGQTFFGTVSITGGAHFVVQSRDVGARAFHADVAGARVATDSCVKAGCFAGVALTGAAAGVVQY